MLKDCPSCHNPLEKCSSIGSWSGQRCFKCLSEFTSYSKDGINHYYTFKTQDFLLYFYLPECSFLYNNLIHIYSLIELNKNGVASPILYLTSDKLNINEFTKINEIIKLYLTLQ